MGSLDGAPLLGADPVVQFGWDRKSQSFKDIQSAYAQQNMDTYKLGRCLLVIIPRRMLKAD